MQLSLSLSLSHYRSPLSLYNPRFHSYPCRSARASLFLFSPLGHGEGSITRAHVYYMCLRLYLYSISKTCACCGTNVGYQIKSDTYNVSLIAALPFFFFFGTSAVVRVVKRKMRMATRATLLSHYVLFISEYLSNTLSINRATLIYFTSLPFVACNRRTRGALNSFLLKNVHLIRD